MTPEVLECSWIPLREGTGRGRVDLVGGGSYWALDPAKLYTSTLTEMNPSGELGFYVQGQWQTIKATPQFVSGTVTTMLTKFDYDKLHGSGE